MTFTSDAGILSILILYSDCVSIRVERSTLFLRRRMEERLRELREQIEPLLAAMGFTLVEAGEHRSKGQSLVSVVIYRQDGVGIDDCAAVSRNLLPRLELMAGLVGVRLEVSSPGLERVFKSPAEYEIFKGRGIKVWLRDAADWLEGVNSGVQGGVLALDRGGRTTSIRLEDIVKAKLDPRS